MDDRFQSTEKETVDYATELRLQEKNDAIARNRRLSAETNKRRKLLANKRKLEAQREEKRRQEILAKRRDQQKFATERFQRGHVTKRHDTSYVELRQEHAPVLEEALKAVRGSVNSRQYSQDASNAVYGNHSTMAVTEGNTSKSYYHKYGAYVMQRTPERARQHMKEIADRTELHYRSLNNLSSSKTLFEKQLEQSQQQLVLQHQKALNDLSAAALEIKQAPVDEVRGSTDSLCSVDSLDNAKNNGMPRYLEECSQNIGHPTHDSRHTAHDSDHSGHDTGEQAQHTGHPSVSDVQLEDANDNVSDILEEVLPKQNYHSGQASIKSVNGRQNTCSSRQSSGGVLNSRQAGSANVINRRIQSQDNNRSSYLSNTRKVPITNGNLDNPMYGSEQPVGSEREHVNKAWSSPTPDILLHPMTSTPKTTAVPSPKTHSATTKASPISNTSVPKKADHNVPSENINSNSDIRSSYTISNNNDLFTQACKPLSTAITNGLHKVSSEPVISGCQNSDEEGDDDDMSSTQSAPEPQQEIKGILKRPQPGERRTVFTRKGSQSTPNIRDSIEITKEHQYKQQVLNKKSVRFADRHYEKVMSESEEEAEESIQQTVYKKPPIPHPQASVPRPQPARMGTQSTEVISRKPPRPVSAKLTKETKDIVKPQRSASAGSVRPGPMLKPKAGSPKTMRRTVYKAQEEWEHCEPLSHSQPTQPINPVYDEKGIRLDKTPTDDEINWLWEKVRTCLNRSSTGSVSDSQHIRSSPGQHSQPNQISATLTDSSQVSINGTLPRRKTANESPRANGTLLHRRQPNPSQASVSQLQCAGGYQRPMLSQQEPAMSQNNEVSVSMAAFLTAEAMSEHAAPDMEIQQAMDAAQLRQQTHLAGRPSFHVPSALSVEEQRLMQSLDRLNERLRVTDINPGVQGGIHYEGDKHMFGEGDITNSSNKSTQNGLHKRTTSESYSTNKPRNHYRMGSGSLPRKQHRY